MSDTFEKPSIHFLENSQKREIENMQRAQKYQQEVEAIKRSER